MFLLRIVDFLFIFFQGLYGFGYALADIFRLGWLFAVFWCIAAFPSLFAAAAGLIPAMLILLVLSITCGAESSSCQPQDPWAWATVSYYRLYLFCVISSAPFLVWLWVVNTWQDANDAPSLDGAPAPGSIPQDSRDSEIS